eukprot:scaffold148399_cov36-Tisochrysis_lutea.AAC.3
MASTLAARASSLARMFCSRLAARLSSYAITALAQRKRQASSKRETVAPAARDGRGRKRVGCLGPPTKKRNGEPFQLTTLYECLGTPPVYSCLRTYSFHMYERTALLLDPENHLRFTAGGRASLPPRAGGY